MKIFNVASFDHIVKKIALPRQIKVFVSMVNKLTVRELIVHNE